MQVMLWPWDMRFVCVSGKMAAPLRRCHCRYCWRISSACPSVDCAVTAGRSTCHTVAIITVITALSGLLYVIA